MLPFIPIVFDAIVTTFKATIVVTEFATVSTAKYFAVRSATFNSIYSTNEISLNPTKHLTICFSHLPTNPVSYCTAQCNSIFSVDFATK
jgi:hypothetical protein